MEVPRLSQSNNQYQSSSIVTPQESFSSRAIFPRMPEADRRQNISLGCLSHHILKFDGITIELGRRLSQIGWSSSQLLKSTPVIKRIGVSATTKHSGER